jgi:hypothetical protein
MIMEENDFLTFQLYTASKTPRIKRGRAKSWALTTFVFICLSFLFFESHGPFLGYYFLVLSISSLILYPFYSRWKYRRHYLKYIRDTYKNKFGESFELEFARDTIRTKDRTGEIRINKSEIEEINEIKDFYFLRARTGTTLIISKNKLDDIGKIKNEIMAMIEDQGVRYNVELDWKWR